MKSLLNDLLVYDSVDKYIKKRIGKKIESKRKVKRSIGCLYIFNGRCLLNKTCQLTIKGIK